jgi:hypothetical protein
MISFKSQKSAILYALINGKWVSPMDCFINFGCTKISTRIGEYEKEFGFVADKEFVDFETKYGTAGNYKKYRFDKDKFPDAYNKIKEYLVMQGESVCDFSKKIKSFTQTSFFQ